ncbi:hypothetical protein G9U51_12870 [Calidifontibacter sp. DB0510]|uniref:Uncharacterized protein n=1 Tax=Metallococcus carri TaxID=1656884 RepID=A0A967EB83_9MICO|nr:hypothetical protein [Metallococcus carri]NHN56674.1 hypothetical protein [Metallococcus carri]NOP38973.1 hypothetical protein [Calidifontibacter sp. DB2511S]
MTGLIVAALMAAAAGYLWFTAARDRREWVSHASQVRLVREWERQQRTAPYDRQAPARPPVTSPYAAPAEAAPPALPPAPGLTRALWGAILLSVALLVLAAEIAAR